MLKKMKWIGMVCVMSLILFAAAFADTDEKTVSAMTEFNTAVGRIKSLPDAINEDICGGNWDSYRSHMTELAQNIIEANTIIKDVQLYYPIDLWYIYNVISADPICGIGKRAMEVFSVADTSRITNEEMMGILPNDDICGCWNIATGREEPTGYMEAGHCRCTYGTKALNPRIGRNDVPWVEPEN